ncbi:hypothetical protein CEXT_238981 [Caerostris extrusa]|uniref:Uncharacterized protein n=1 Tax=Caerostris extrusa TaxID=172846 RepID=A0AAV4R7Q6_CAEEX|nr:hypothetical protein CEXT_238981 [Caerostris extrusa]
MILSKGALIWRRAYLSRAPKTRYLQKKESTGFGRFLSNSPSPKRESIAREQRHLATQKGKHLPILGWKRARSHTYICPPSERVNEQADLGDLIPGILRCHFLYSLSRPMAVVQTRNVFLPPPSTTFGIFSNRRLRYIWGGRYRQFVWRLGMRAI